MRRYPKTLEHPEGARRATIAARLVAGEVAALEPRHPGALLSEEGRGVRHLPPSTPTCPRGVWAHEVGGSGRQTSAQTVLKREIVSG